MKQLTFKYKEREYQAIMYLDGHGVCDITVYRKRLNKKWYQCKWQHFTDFVYCPDTLENLILAIKTKVKEKIHDEEEKDALFRDYKQLEDVPFI